MHSHAIKEALQPAAKASIGLQRDSVEFLPALNPSTLRDASALVSRMYAWRGLGSENAKIIEEAPHLVTLVASREESVLGTLTLGLDGPDGLSAERHYSTEIAPLRKPGRRLCEMTRLAVDTPKERGGVLSALFHLAYIYAHQIHQITDVIIEVHPRHASYYRRMFGFVQAGPERLCTRVDAPAVLMHLDGDQLRFSPRFRRIAEQLGSQDVTGHRGRHEAASFAQRQVPQQEIQRL